jgi:hypothetical protein
MAWLENKIELVNKDLARILGKLAYHLAPEIVDYIVKININDYDYFERLFGNKIEIGHYLFAGSACVFPGIRRYVSNKKDAAGKYDTKYRAIVDDNVFPRHVWCFLINGKGFSGQNWKTAGLNEFELAHIFVHKESEIDNEKDFFREIYNGTCPYGEFTSAANVVLLPKGTVRPTDNSAVVKAVFYKRYIELYGEQTLNGRRGFIETKVPDWYSDITWNDPFLPNNWKKNIDSLMEYRKKRLTTKLEKKGKNIPRKTKKTGSPAAKREPPVRRGIKPPSRKKPPAAAVNGKKEILVFEFVPNDKDVFKQKLVKTKKARRTWYYSNGKIETDFWNAHNLKETSNLMGNIKSNCRVRKGNTTGLIKIKFEIVELFEKLKKH